jgi:hypothetical protein
MDAIQLTDPDVAPDDAVLERVLGESFPAYRRLLGLFDENGMTHEWRYYRDGKAWLCKVQKKARTIVWMSAWDGYVKATVYVPEKHIEGLFELDIPDDEKQRIRGAKRVGTSTPCSFDIKTDEVLTTFAKVMRYKIESK